jgi:hypothetical protein
MILLEISDIIIYIIFYIDNCGSSSILQYQFINKSKIKVFYVKSFDRGTHGFDRFMMMDNKVGNEFRACYFFNGVFS